MKDIPVLIFGMIIAGGFLYAIYTFLPLGAALSITGAALTTLTLNKENKTIQNIGRVASLLYPIGIVICFIQNGFLWGVASIVIGMMAYSYAKTKR